MYYNDEFESCYEELKLYYPKFYENVLEMQAILQTDGRLADEMQDNIEQVLDNCFIDTADETTIGKLEQFLYLGLYKQRSLDERRRLVKSFFVGSGKVSASMISEMISAYTGAAVAILFEPFDEAQNNKLYIDFERGQERTLYLSDILSLIEKKIPAHLEYRIALCYSFPVVCKGMAGKHYGYVHEFCGTKPQIATLADKIAASTETTSAAGTVTSAKFDYIPCGTRRVGS